MSKLKLRSAENGDLEKIIALTREQRRNLAAWSPVYFNPREGADQGHAGFLQFIVSSDDHETLVVEHDSVAVAFLVRIQQQDHVWIDDLCVDDPSRWSEVIETMDLEDSGWVTCVAAADLKRISALHQAGAHCLSRYWVRSTSGIAASPSLATGPIDTDPSLAAPHTWGAFTAELPGSLMVIDSLGGYAIGSPSASPPIYDPGGPTCVIDQVVGEDRADLVEQALAACAARGDAQVVVVCKEGDDTLAAILKQRDFTAEVLLIGA